MPQRFYVWMTKIDVSPRHQDKDAMSVQYAPAVLHLARCSLGYALGAFSTRSAPWNQNCICQGRRRGCSRPRYETIGNGVELVVSDDGAAPTHMARNLRPERALKIISTLVSVPVHCTPRKMDCGTVEGSGVTQGYRSVGPLRLIDITANALLFSSARLSGCSTRQCLCLLTEILSLGRSAFSTIRRTVTTTSAQKEDRQGRREDNSLSQTFLGSSEDGEASNGKRWIGQIGGGRRQCPYVQRPPA